MDVIIAVNDAYCEVCRTMLHSLFTKNHNSSITVHLLYKQLRPGKQRRLRRYVEKLGGIFHSYIVQDSVFLNLPYQGSATNPIELFPIEVYYRILAYQILPADMKRALWLDADIIITSDISWFYSQPFDDMDLIACADLGEGQEYIKERKEAMGLAESHIYFNTGVLLYNLEKIRRDIHKAKLRNIISRYVSHLKYPDQDLLNKIFEGKVKYADGRIYNNQFYGKPYEDYIEDACMLHYVYIYKPWKPTLARKNYTYYWNERLAMGDRAGYLLFTLLYRTYHRYKTVNYYCKVFAARVIKMITYKH